ncbi:xanthine dehydrogenase family protein molybdopterin-binding subunit [Streptomyces sp. NPDC050658]|uniref:xanthine dehydrogenase family protein molybdopterin-binding subunit n=1 Tax=unclassified Streptomyces TaxID=2593676 RepID=UPI00343E231B
MSSANATGNEASGKWIGRALPNSRSSRLLRGQGYYVDDIQAPRTLHAAVVRSPVAHGRILKWDAGEALSETGAKLALGPDEIGRFTEPLPMAWTLPGQNPHHIELAINTVRYVGQPIGVVVADSRAEAEDAAERVRLEIAPLPVAATTEAALAPGAPLLYPENGTNLAGSAELGDTAEEIARVMDEAAHIVTRNLSVQRIAHSPMEPRGVLADWLPHTECLTVWNSTQSPHVVRQDLAVALRLRADQIRVVAPDVGGSFGGKAMLHPDEAMVCLASMRLGRAVRWTEDRRENLTAAYQGRGQSARARLALDAQGRFLTLDAHIVGDLGAFPSQAGSGPFQATGMALEGPYRFVRAGATVDAVYTNAAPTGAYRGYGMQEASWIRERLIDEAARELGLDPVELRLRNSIRPKDLPYTTRSGFTYDSGDYPAALLRAAKMANSRRRVSEGAVSRGSGITMSVELTGYAPTSLLGALGIDAAGWESGKIRVNQDGTVTVFSGVIPVGQGIETALAQIVADRMGVPLSWISVQLGDTAATPYSDLSSQASRSVTLAGGALMLAADRMRGRMRSLAARRLGVDPNDVMWEVEPGNAPTTDTSRYRATDSAQTVSWRDVAHRAWKGWDRNTHEERIQLEETVDFDPPALTFAYGVHGAAVAVNRETGKVTVEDYWTVHDSGNLVNPALAEGQIIGGVAQGIGLALLEEAQHDPVDGKPLAVTLQDYALPRTADVPRITVEHLHTPSEIIPGGFKGLGEGGAIPPPATIAAAIADAVPHIAGSLTHTPMTPFVIWSALDASNTPPDAT